MNVSPTTMSGTHEPGSSHRNAADSDQKLSPTAAGQSRSPMRRMVAQPSSPASGPPRARLFAMNPRAEFRSRRGPYAPASRLETALRRAGRGRRRCARPRRARLGPGNWMSSRITAGRSAATASYRPSPVRRLPHHGKTLGLEQ